MNKSFVLVLILTISIFNLSSCKTKKSVKKTITTDNTTISQQNMDTLGLKKSDSFAVAATPVISPEKQMLIDSLKPIWQQHIDYSTFNGKAKMHYEGKDQSLDFTANFRIRKDSVIWVQVIASVLSIQFARVCITPDTIKLIYYLQKEVTIMPFSRANELLPTKVEFSELQNLIIGNALRAQSNPTNVDSVGDAWSLQSEDAQYVQQFIYNKSDSALRSSQMKTHNNVGPSAMIRYSNYATVNGRKFSNNRAININNGPDQHDLEMNFNTATFDQALEFPFSIPKNYSVK